MRRREGRVCHIKQRVSKEMECHILVALRIELALICNRNKLEEVEAASKLGTSLRKYQGLISKSLKKWASLLKTQKLKLRFKME